MRNGILPATIRAISAARSFCIFISVILFATVFTNCRAAAEDPIDVSVVNLIATPERYDHKLVRVSGFMTILPVGTIWLHRDDYENRLAWNGVLLVMVEEQTEALKGCDKTYGVVVGRFLRSKTGPDGLLDLATLSTEEWNLIRCPIVKMP